MDAISLATLAVALSTLLSLAALKAGCLTKDGAAASLLVGSFTGIFGSLEAFILMTIFTVTGFAATWNGLSDKKKRGLQEGKKGERTWKNVAGVGIPPCAIVLINAIWPMEPTLFFVAFISTMTVAGADTIASEIGIRDRKVFLITNFKKVSPGTNGGVSLLGTAISTAASLAIAILGWLIMAHTLDWVLIIPFIAGVFGNFMDSVLGATLEDRGIISKYANNCVTALMGAAFGAGACIAAGYA